MKNDITIDQPADMTAMNKPSQDESMADPVAVVLMLQREAGFKPPEYKPSSAPLRQAKIKERVLRRMLDNSLVSAGATRKPHLKLVK